jgi:fructan beta-fructosidase
LNSKAPTSSLINRKTPFDDFRDPKVMFHTFTDSWILVLTGGDHVQFYKSIDLIHWSFVSNFGYTHGSHGGTWECPDLIEFPQATINNKTSLWVLLVSVQNGPPAGGSGMQYFIGTFDGFTFQNIQSPQTINWLDYGPDFYAGITYHNIPRFDGRQIMISWMNNWQYAQDVPTAPLWRGQMAIPRQLQLDFNSFTNSFHLRQSPVYELHSYSKQLFTFHRRTLSSSTSNILSNISSNVFMLLSEFHNVTKTSVIRLRVRQSLDKNEYTEMKYIGEKNAIELDRSHSGNIGFHPAFRTQFNVMLDNATPTTGILKLHLIVDRCSVEIFINNGKYTMTALIFPKFEGRQMELLVEGQTIVLNYLELMLL